VEIMVEHLVEKRAAAQPGYDSVAKTLHWLILVLLIAQYGVAWTMPNIGRNTPAVGLVSLHFSIGVTILAIVILRLLWRWTHPVPTLRGIVPSWQVALAYLSHGLLYLVLLVLPILGWVDSGFRGYSIDFFGLFTIPQLIASSPALAGRTGDIHAFVGTLLLILVGLHVLAAFSDRAARRCFLPHAAGARLTAIA
jgi:cytochrome b561